ncbi:MAG TPA: flavodoxin domain-containing protein [Trueperaceae bacterium]|nr:flavodoxin domain-containing protein [Trueperaceae bacterium]
MEQHVLVVYASKYGATQGIAEAIGSSLRQAGLAVDVLPCRDVKDLHGYTAVVLGSAVYMGRWRREAADFLRNGEGQLARLPVWLFSSGPTGAGDLDELLDGWRFPIALEPIADRIAPRDIAVFHGALDEGALGPFDAFIARTVKAPSGDFRDLDVVRAWAQQIARALQETDVPGATAGAPVGA